MIENTQQESDGMTEFQKRCMGCMEPLSWDGRCEHCHFIPEKYKVDVHQLPLEYKLHNGAYTVGRVLGEGGFGITYLGFDNVLLDTVAIKEYYPVGLVERDMTASGSAKLHIHSGKPAEEFEQGCRSFLQEARLLARFDNCESVVRVRSFFEENNTVYIVMEYVKGTSVRDYVRKYGPLRGQQVCSMLQPVLRSLQTMHEKKLIHRDISADNLIIREDGRVTLIDFGAMRWMSSVDDETRTMMYKPGFSAIEQYSRTGKQGPWTDVYGICATMYFMLTGEVPLNCTERISRDELPSLVEMKQLDITGEQSRAVMKGLAVESKERFQTVAEFYEVLYREPMKAQEKIFHASVVPEKKSAPGVIFTRTSLGRELKKMQNAEKRTAMAKGGAGVFLLLIFVGAFFLFQKSAGISKDVSVEQTGVSAASVSAVEISVEETPQPSPSPTAFVEKKIQVPSVVGKREKKAKKILQGAGFKVKVVSRHSETVKKGNVITQKPGEKKKCLPGKTVKIYVSLGAKEKTNNKSLSNPTETPRTTKAPQEDIAGSLDSVLQ